VRTEPSIDVPNFQFSIVPYGGGFFFIESLQFFTLVQSALQIAPYLKGYSNSSWLFVFRSVLLFSISRPTPSVSI
jgi:hypothetical protein